MYPGDTVVARSITLGEPVVFVSANYRLNGIISYFMMMMMNDPTSVYLAFGFLGGKEVQAANIGNIGLRDRTSIGNAYIVALC